MATLPEPEPATPSHCCFCGASFEMAVPLGGGFGVATVVPLSAGYAAHPGCLACGSDGTTRIGGIPQPPTYAGRGHGLTHAELTTIREAVEAAQPATDWDVIQVVRPALEAAHTRRREEELRQAAAPLQPAMQKPDPAADEIKTAIRAVHKPGAKRVDQGAVAAHMGFDKATIRRKLPRDQNWMRFVAATLAES